MFLALLMAGCRVVEPQPAPTAAIQVGREQAARAAEAACPGIYLRPVEPARLVQARLTSRSQAEAISACAGQEWPACLSATLEPAPLAPLAWLVELEGSWAYGGPPAPAQPDSTPYPPTHVVILTHCLAVVDAQSGEASPVRVW